MIAILVTMLMALARSFMGPSLYDRILAINTAVKYGNLGTADPDDTAQGNGDTPA